MARRSSRYSGSRYINKMRQDAVRRSCSSNRDADIPPQMPDGAFKYDENRASDEADEKSVHCGSEPSALKLDSDKLLVAAILFMLAREGGDMRLIIALCYILL